MVDSHSDPTGYGKLEAHLQSIGKNLMVCLAGAIAPR